MISLVGLQEAKDHLRVTNTEAEADITLKISIASEILLDYLKMKEPPPEWVTVDSPVTYVIPALIKGATLLILGELYMNREASVSNILPPRMQELLDRYRDPALA